MSAPDTNTEKQEKAHKAPLRIGILLPLAFVATIAVITFLVIMLRGQSPEGADARVDSRTGEVEAVGTESVEPGIPGAD